MRLPGALSHIKKDMKLIRELTRLQEAHDFLTADLLHELARRENVPLYRLQGLVSFYPHFCTTPPPRVEVAVCRDMSCWLAGAPRQCGRVKEACAGLPGVEVHSVSCLGRCELAPAAAINGVPVAVRSLALPAGVFGDLT